MVDKLYMGQHSQDLVLAGWIFCQKLVIFCFTLSHYFDHFRNGSIKSDLIFLYNFSTRVRICNQI